MPARPPSQDNRREAFRVTEQALLMIQPEGGGAGDATGMIEDFDLLHDVMTELQRHERDLGRILGSFTDREQPLTAALRILNRKFEALSRWVVATRIKAGPEAHCDISLSETGLAFDGPRAFPPGKRLHLRALLLPDYLPLKTLAEVIDQTPCVGGFHTRIRFLDLDNEQRDLLARHVLRTQQVHRRSQVE